MYSVAYAALGGDPTRMSSMLGVLRVLKEGLPVPMFEIASETMGSKKSVFAKLIGSNVLSLQRKKEVHLSPRQSEHILAIISVYASATEYFDDEYQAKE